MDADFELVKRCLKGEDAAWEALLRAYTHKIYSLCYRFTGRPHDAEDLTQEVFKKVTIRLRRNFPPGSIELHGTIW